MPDDDLNLLREYARNQSEEAFATLVSRHVNLVYSVALRKVDDAHLAGEITQAVFIILARKADSLGDKTIMAGWLCRTARYASANALTIQRRRQHREQEAYMQSTLNEAEPVETWNQIAPLLDGAMEQLGQKDHDALVLRFFENKSFVEVGASLGASEDAAKMRVNRALEKLRKFFTKRGVRSTTAIIAGTISANSVHAAPVALAKSVTVVAIVKGAAVSTSTLILINGALKIMAWTKAKTAIVVTASVLLATGTAIFTGKRLLHRLPPYAPRYAQTMAGIAQIEAKMRVFYEPLPPIMIAPTKFSSGNQHSWASDGEHRLGYNEPLQTLIDTAFPSRYVFHTRMIIESNLPQGKYDFNADLPQGSAEALQKELKQTLGVEGIQEERITAVLCLKVKNQSAAGLKSPAHSLDLTSPKPPGQMILPDQTISSTLVTYLENYFKVPVVDQTGLTNRFDIFLTWDQSDRRHFNVQGLKQALLDQLGLELVPTNLPVKMLVVENMK
jgi:uncharacterized protein (TIGR03435 family)